MRVIVGISGASGAIYGIRLLQALHDIPDIESHLILSRYGRVNIELETDYSVADVEALADVVHSDRNLAASVSSGSFRCDAMIVAPCSMKTLSAIAHSHSDSLLVRAADVTLKDCRKLILVPRESPMHLGHLRLLVQVAEMGAVVAPPVPAFYNRPTSIDAMVNHTVGRLLDLLGLDAGLVERWAGLSDRKE